MKLKFRPGLSKIFENIRQDILIVIRCVRYWPVCDAFRDTIGSNDVMDDHACATALIVYEWKERRKRKVEGKEGKMVEGKEETGKPHEVCP